MRIKVVSCKIGEMPCIKEIDNTLSSMQAEVGGYIECVPLTRDGKVVIVCDEQGILKNRPINPALSMILMITGDCFICSEDETGEFVSLSDDVANVLLAVTSAAI